jgi:hypothetical protein
MVVLRAIAKSRTRQARQLFDIEQSSVNLWRRIAKPVRNSIGLAISRLSKFKNTLLKHLDATRPSVSIAAGILKEEGLIDYNRGVIRILDAKHMEERACEYYHVIKDYLDGYSDLDSTFIS